MSSSISIGSLKLANNYFMAPMTKVTDLPFRLIAKKYTPGLMYTEMIDAKSLISGRSNTLKRAQSILLEESPIGLQLFGTQENKISQSIKLLEENFDLFDINLGCPTKEVISQGAGVCLLQRPEKVKKIIVAMRRATDKPITAKIRIGINNSNNIIKTAKIIQESGADAICIHGRTAEQSYKTPANWKVIKEVKNSINIPVIGNGDIFTSDHANKHLKEQEADAVIIGRSALHNLKIFAQCRNPNTPEASIEERWDWIRSYFHLAHKYQCFTISRFRKRISDFLHPLLSIEQKKFLENLKEPMRLEILLNTLKNWFPEDFNLYFTIKLFEYLDIVIS